MAVVMEVRCTCEVSDRDTAIEALKAKIERLEGEKGGVCLTPLQLSACLWRRRSKKRMV